MQLFYAPDLRPPGGVLPPEESRHALRVLRLGAGAEVWAADGEGTLYRCRVEGCAPDACTVRILEATRGYGQRPYRLMLAVAPPKNGDRFEWLVEKAVEVGVDRIVPLCTARSERRIFRPERSERIITAAMKQSLKALRPQLAPLTPFSDLLGTREEPEPVRCIAHCAEPRGERRHLYDVVPAGRDAVVAIGPEGDFTDEEIDAALTAGFVEVTLGRERLRTETAALAAVQILSVRNR